MTPMPEPSTNPPLDCLRQTSRFHRKIAEARRNLTAAFNAMHEAGSAAILLEQSMVAGELLAYNEQVGHTEDMLSMITEKLSFLQSEGEAPDGWECPICHRWEDGTGPCAHTEPPKVDKQRDVFLRDVFLRNLAWLKEHHPNDPRIAEIEKALNA